MRKEDFKVGMKVKHKARPYYQKSVVVKIEEGCNGGITIDSEDGFYGGKERTTFPPQDLILSK